MYFRGTPAARAIVLKRTSTKNEPGLLAAVISLNVANTVSIVDIYISHEGITPQNTRIEHLSFDRYGDFLTNQDIAENKLSGTLNWLTQSKEGL